MFVNGMDGTVGMGHKKARRACAVRALRTSSDDSGNHRWRILVGWRELNPHLLFFNLLIYMLIIYVEYAACTSRVFFKEFLDLLILG